MGGKEVRDVFKFFKQFLNSENFDIQFYSVIPQLYAKINNLEWLLVCKPAITEFQPEQREGRK